MIFPSTRVQAAELPVASPTLRTIGKGFGVKEQNIWEENDHTKTGDAWLPGDSNNNCEDMKDCLGKQEVAHVLRIFHWSLFQHGNKES